MFAKKLARSPNLVQQVRQSLIEEIQKDAYKVGDALPSESALCESLGVSRSVMREAISHLRAEKMIETRQGVGAFVAAKQIYRPFEMTPLADSDYAALKQVIEFRVGFEVEAAGLAAARRRRKHIDQLQAALATMAQAIEAGDVERGVAADIRFHEVICEATANPHFEAFFAFLRQYLAPSIRVSRAYSSKSHRSHFAQDEHLAMFEAIVAANVEAARAAARAHIAGTAERAASARSLD